MQNTLYFTSPLGYDFGTATVMVLFGTINSAIPKQKLCNLL
jgi:hypothetical protein